MIDQNQDQIYQSQPVSVSSDIAPAGPAPVAPEAAPGIDPVNLAQNEYSNVQRPMPSAPRALKTGIEYLSNFWDDVKAGTGRVTDLIKGLADSDEPTVRAIDGVTSDDMAKALGSMPRDIEANDRNFKGRTWANILNVESLFGGIGPEAAKQQIAQISDPFDRTVAQAYTDTYYNSNFDRNAAAQMAIKAAEAAREQKLKLLAEQQGQIQLLETQEKATDAARQQVLKNSVKSMMGEIGSGRLTVQAADGTRVQPSAQIQSQAQQLLQSALQNDDFETLRPQFLQLLPDAGRIWDNANARYQDKLKLIERNLLGNKLRGTPVAGDSFVYNYLDKDKKPAKQFIREFVDPMNGKSTLYDITNNQPLSDEERKRIAPYLQRTKDDVQAAGATAESRKAGGNVGDYRTKDLKGATAATETLAKQEAEKLPDIDSKLGKVNDALVKIDQGTNYGPILSTVKGRGALARGVGAQFETDAQRRTQEIQDVITQIANFKVLAGSISEKEFLWLKERQPQFSDSPERVKEWLIKAKEALEGARQRASAYSGITPPDTSAPAAPAAPGSSPRRGTAANPIRLD